MPETPQDSRYVTVDHGTTLWLGFIDGKLETVQVGQSYGLKGLKLYPLENLCTGARTGYAQVTFVGPPELAGAKILMDGRYLVQFSYDRSDGRVQVVVGSLPSGTHEIRIEQAGYEPVVRQLDLGPTDSKAKVAITAGDLVRRS